MPVRGKILNCLKADYARIFKSDVITDLMRVLGCGVEVQSSRPGSSAFNSRTCAGIRSSSAPMPTDGFQSARSSLTMLHWLAPTLIREGYVHRRVALV